MKITLSREQWEKIGTKFGWIKEAIKERPPVSVYRDPFSRHNIMRRKAPIGSTCRECGQPAKWEYGYNADSIRNETHWEGKYFCSVGCRRTYNG